MVINNRTKLITLFNKVINFVSSLVYLWRLTCIPLGISVVCFWCLTYIHLTPHLYAFGIRGVKVCVENSGFLLAKNCL